MFGPATYDPRVTARRDLPTPDCDIHGTLGCEGPYVSPYHLNCDNRSGRPVQIRFNWFDAPTARAHVAPLRRIGHLRRMLFNRVPDTALAPARLARADVDPTRANHLLQTTRTAALRHRVINDSFDVVTRYKVARADRSRHAGASLRPPAPALAYRNRLHPIRAHAG